LHRPSIVNIKQCPGPDDGDASEVIAFHWWFHSKAKPGAAMTLHSATSENIPLA
jgi:hypothetical protein